MEKMNTELLQARIKNRVLKKKAIINGLLTLINRCNTGEVPKKTIIEAGAFRMTLIFRKVFQENILLKLKNKATRLPDEKLKLEILPRYPHAQKDIPALVSVALIIYGNANNAHARLLWQYQHAADLGLDRETTIALANVIRTLADRLQIEQLRKAA